MYPIGYTGSFVPATYRIILDLPKRAFSNSVSSVSYTHLKLIVSGSLHRRQERVFRVLLRGRCEVFGDAGGHTIQNIALMDFGQGLHGIILFLRLEGGLEQLFDGFPSVLNDGLPLGFELVALAGERDLRFCVGEMCIRDSVRSFVF